MSSRIPTTREQISNILTIVPPEEWTCEESRAVLNTLEGVAAAWLARTQQ